MSHYSIPVHKPKALKNFFYSIPPGGLDFEDQLNTCIEQIQSLIRSGTYNILKVSFFLDASNAEAFRARKRLLLRAIHDNFDMPFPCSFVAQAPINSEIAADVCYVDSSSLIDFKIEYKSLESFRYAVLSIGDVKEIISAGITFFDNGLSMYGQLTRAFGVIEQILLKEGMDLSTIVRQWNYIEEIIGEKKCNGKIIQNYQLLNDVRELFYRKYTFPNGYPSATGIGMKTGGAVLEFIAVSLREGVTAISNVDQIDAHRYSPAVLVGEVLDQLGYKATPKFERAKLVITDEAKEIYISGTAAIKGEETLGIGDVVKQAFDIIDNISKLLAVENLEKQGIFIGEALMEYFSLRIYIKDKNDAGRIARIVNDGFRGVQALIVVADICRSDLLIEIEGMCHLKQ